MVLAVRVIVQGSVPVQPPPVQPSNVEPVAGVAVRVTTVPLSKAAVALLEQLPDKSADGPVFVGSRPGEPLGKDALQRALARMGHADITVHGTARSTFRDWAAERTAFSYAARELALAHVVHSKQSRAYERTDLLDERRRLMEAWATFCHSPSAAGELVPMRKAARP